MAEKPKARRGFAAMSKEKQLELSRKGGAATPREKRTFFRDRGLAAEAAVIKARLAKAAKAEAEVGEE